MWFGVIMLCAISLPVCDQNSATHVLRSDPVFQSDAECKLDAIERVEHMAKQWPDGTKWHVDIGCYRADVDI